jgi:hypothetical protein
MDILTKDSDTFDVIEKRLNQHRLVRATVFNLALTSLAALAFVIMRVGFDFKLFSVLIGLSIVFVALSFFTGRRSAETLYFEMFHVYTAINGAEKTDPGDKKDHLGRC